MWYNYKFICPECGSDDGMLLLVCNAIEATEIIIVDESANKIHLGYGEVTTYPDDSTGTYRCSECWEVVASSEEDLQQLIRNGNILIYSDTQQSGGA